MPKLDRIRPEACKGKTVKRIDYGGGREAEIFFTDGTSILFTADTGQDDEDRYPVLDVNESGSHRW